MREIDNAGPDSPTSKLVESIELPIRERRRFDAVFYDDRSTRLIGAYGLDWTVADTEIATVVSDLTTASLELSAHAAGATTIELVADSLRETFSVTVAE